jgi:2,3-bisphosphoglycerate-independent phosphoglycerate mutase
VVDAAQKGGFSVIIIADHGNCDTMVNPDGSPNTAHTTNPVPIILISDKHKEINDGNLGNIAPTVLELMGVKQPQEMTAKSLL